MKEKKTIHRVENVNVVAHEDMVQENSKSEFEFFFQDLQTRTLVLMTLIGDCNNCCLRKALEWKIETWRRPTWALISLFFFKI